MGDLFLGDLTLGDKTLVGITFRDLTFWDPTLGDLTLGYLTLGDSYIHGLDSGSMKVQVLRSSAGAVNRRDPHPKYSKYKIKNQKKLHPKMFSVSNQNILKA